jgi:hypothetical protein
MSARAKPQDGTGAMGGGYLRIVQTRESGSVTSTRYAAAGSQCVPATVVHKGKNTALSKRIWQFNPLRITPDDYYNPKMMPSANVKRSGPGRRARSMQENAGVQVSERPEAKAGEQASRVVTRTLWCV